MGKPRIPLNLPMLPPMYARARNLIRQREKPVRQLIRRMTDLLGDRVQPEDARAIRRWCELEFLISGAFGDLMMRGLVSAEGNVHGLAFLYRQLIAEQRQYAREIGLTPSARMALKTSSSNAIFDLPSSMIESVLEVGESRARERAAKADGAEVRDDAEDEDQD